MNSLAYILYSGDRPNPGRLILYILGLVVCYIILLKIFKVGEAPAWAFQLLNLVCLIFALLVAVDFFFGSGW